MRKLALIIVMLLGVSTLFAQKSAEAYNAGFKKYKSKTYPEAIIDFQTAINEAKAEGKDKKTLGKYNHISAIAAYKGEKYEVAIAYADTCMQMDYKKKKMYTIKSNCYSKMEDDENYEATLLKAVEEVPKDEEFALKLGLLYYNHGAELKTEAAKIVQTDNEGYKDELKKSKVKFEKASPYLKKAKEIIDAKLAKVTKEKKKKALENDLKKATDAMGAIDASLKEIAEALK